MANNMEIKHCDCDPWITNIPKIDRAFGFMAINNISGYDGEKFIYCPWCSKKLMSIEQNGK